MADINYNDHASKAAPTVDDFVPIWDVAASQSKKATIANLFNARLTGGGIIATGGFTLTVPATGTAALLGTANTFTALNTFNAGLTFGDQTLSSYAAGSWTPSLIGSSTAGANTYTVRVGRYVKIGLLVTAWFRIIINVKDAAMAGDVNVGGLPFTVLNTADMSYGSFVSHFSSLVNSVVFVSLLPTTNATTAGFRKLAAAATSTSAMVAADIQSGTVLVGVAVYEAA